MENKRNLWVIPTDKPSRLHKIGNELGLTDKPNSNFLAKQQNIYITNSEEIKEGDWFVVELFNIQGKSKGLNIEKCTKLDDVWCNNFDVISTRHKNNCKKIILTTDSQLITDGIQAIDDEFLEWFVKNPSCEKVEAVSISRCCGKCYVYNDLCVVDKCCDDHHEYGCEICYGKKIDYKIIIPKEEPKQRLEKYSERFDNKDNEIVEGIFNPETWGKRMVDDVPKQETLEEAAERILLEEDLDLSDYDKRHIFKAMVNIAKWQQQQENTANDILNYILTNDDGVGIALGYNSKEMIEQHFKNIGYDK